MNLGFIYMGNDVALTQGHKKEMHMQLSSLSSRVASLSLTALVLVDNGALVPLI